MSGATYTTNELLCLYRNSSDATEMKLVVGSNGTTYKNVNLTGFSGIGQYTQTFVSIQDDDVMNVYMYDHFGGHISTQAVTIDSSQFGTNYTKWSLNNKANDPSTGRPQIQDKAGYWNKTLTTQERTDWVAANADVPYVQFTYDASNYPSGYSNPDGGDYRLVVSSGACHAVLDPSFSTLLQDVNVTMYFKSMLTNGTDDGGALFMLSTGSTIYDNKGLLTLVRANAAATTMDFVVGSNGVNHREDLGLTGFPGTNHYTHVFILVKSTNELEARVYDDTEALVYSSTTTIVSSTFGTDYDRNLLNGRPDNAVGNGRKQTVKDAGWWQKTLSVAEMEAHVALNPN
jgi:hypothetical protein